MTFLLQPNKMPRGNKGQGKKVALGLPSWRSQRPKCGSLFCLRKALTTSALDRTSSPKETPLTSSDDHYTSQQLAKGHPPQAVQRTSCHWSVHPDPGRELAIQPLNLAHNYTPEAKQKKEQRLLVQAEKKTGDKGVVPSKRPPVLWAEVNTVTTFDGKQAGSDGGDHPQCRPHWAVVSSLLRVTGWGCPTASTGERPGRSNWSTIRRASWLSSHRFT